MVRVAATLLTGLVEKQDAASVSWDANRFRAWVDPLCAGESIVVMAYRAPVECDDSIGGDGIPCSWTNGLVTALAPLTGSCKVLWVARGGAGAPLQDIVERHDTTRAAPSSLRARLRRVSLTAQEERSYYDGFCHEGLWPLCHRASVRPTFRDHDFRMYSLANAQWVAALCEEVTTHSPIVLVQDYHLALTPRMIRARLPVAAIATFWHIPFPTASVLSTCPWERELVEGLLGSSILGFQTLEDCQNFLDAAICVLGAHVDCDGNAACDGNIVSYGGNRTLVHVYPSSVEWPSQWVLHSPPVSACRTSVRRRFALPPETQVIVGIDPLDYTNGLLQKFFAFERLLVTRPTFRGKAVLLQVAELRRSSLSTYKDYRTHVYQMADRINQRFAPSYKPIVLLDRHVNKGEVFELLRASDVCYVGNLHDGMNLVSKEFVSARDDERGVLILSEFAGAARELSDALCINPYAIDDCARTLAEALTMPAEEQAFRMQSLRAVVQHFNAYQWVANVLQDAAAVRARIGHGFGLVRPDDSLGYGAHRRTLNTKAPYARRCDDGRMPAGG
jgi:trehalose-6-phosphate synthase